MRIIFHSTEKNTLKRELTLRFVLLLSLFLVLLVASFVVSSRAISTMEYDSILLNIAGRQRMLIRQYASEINQALVGLASSNLGMALSEKKNAARTAKQFEKIHKSFVLGGEISTHHGGETSTHHGGETSTHHGGENHEGVVSYHDGVLDSIIHPLQEDEEMLDHLNHIEKEWLELKSLALLSLETNKHSISNSPHIDKFLEQVTKTVIEMDHVVLLVQHNSETKLMKLHTILMTMVIIGAALFLLLVYFVYSRIVLPLDGTIGTLRHTTEKLEMEKIRAERANAAKSEFLSRMSHELRTPMNAILGFGQMLKLDAEGFNETQQDNVQEILDAGTHLLGLINEVLDLSKIESGRSEISIEEVDVDDVVQQSLKLIKAQAEARQIEVTDKLSNKGYIVQAGFTRLKQVLVNLLTNAVKYNCAKGRITIDSELIDNQHLRISVTDTGDGLTEEEINKLFTPFERLNVVDNVEGTGIGLVITKHLIENMGGSIGIESTPGKGCTFWIELSCANL